MENKGLKIRITIANILDKYITKLGVVSPSALKAFLEGVMFEVPHTLPKTEYIYYSPVKDKFYYTRTYAPLGTIANKTYYDFIGEL